VPGVLNPAARRRRAGPGAAFQRRSSSLHATASGAPGALARLCCRSQPALRAASGQERSHTLSLALANQGDAEAVREAIGPVIEQARKASLPEYEAMAIANHAWVAWRSGNEEVAAADPQAALTMWEGLPVRYFFDWMALWPLAAMALASGRVEQAVQFARGMLPPPQQLLRDPLRTLVEDAVYTWDSGQPNETADLLRRATSAAGDLGYL
jgi:hypothetical protein